VNKEDIHFKVIKYKVILRIRDEIRKNLRITETTENSEKEHENKKIST
jgi:hypothetical protein